MTYRYHRVTQLFKKTGNIENNIVNRGRTSPSDKRELAKIVMAYRRQLFRNLGSVWSQKIGKIVKREWTGLQLKILDVVQRSFVII